MRTNFKNTSLYGIVGYPLSQSLSPVLMQWAFKWKQLDAAYLLWPQPPETLADFIKSVKLLPLQGVSVTIPHKQTVIPFLDRLTPIAASIGAVNTLFWKNGELWGDNTDVPGFCAPLQRGSFDLALVLGAGGGARAVLAGLKKLQVPQVLVCARSPKNLPELEKRFDCKVIPWEQRLEILCQAEATPRVKYPRMLVINAPPLGMLDNAESEPAISSAEWALLSNPELTVAYDLVYNPLETTFLAGAKKAGCSCVDGLSMLVAQGIGQFSRWTGHALPFSEARTLLLNELI